MKKKIRSFEDALDLDFYVDAVKYYNGKTYYKNPDTNAILLEKEGIVKIQKGMVIDGDIWLSKGVSLIAEEGVIITGGIYYLSDDSKIELSKDTIVNDDIVKWNEGSISNRKEVKNTMFSKGRDCYEGTLDKFSKLLETNASNEDDLAIFYRQKDGRLYVNISKAINSNIGSSLLEVTTMIITKEYDELLIVKELTNDNLYYLIREPDSLGGYRYAIGNNPNEAKQNIKYALSPIEEKRIDNEKENIISCCGRNRDIAKFIKRLCNLPIEEVKKLEKEITEYNPKNNNITIFELLLNANFDIKYILVGRLKSMNEWLFSAHFVQILGN